MLTSKLASNERMWADVGCVCQSHASVITRQLTSLLLLMKAAGMLLTWAPCVWCCAAGPQG